MLEHFTKKIAKNKSKFRVEKVIKREGDKVHVKWKKGYDNSFNSWIDKNDIV